MAQIILQKFESEDLPKLQLLLNDWVTIEDTGEVDQHRIKRILTLAQTEPRKHGDRVYLVAKDATGNILGMIGYKEPCGYMQSFCDTRNAAEVINFYTTDHFTDRSVADAILKHTEDLVLAWGGQEIVINRAPRYSAEVEAYFKTRPDYKYVGVAEGFFGRNLDTPVWVKKV